MAQRHRRLVVLRGAPDKTRQDALSQLSAHRDADVLWVSAGDSTRFVHVPPRAVRRELGRSFDIVVLDLHRGLDPDVLGQCHGFIWGGGALLLRMPPRGSVPKDPRLAVHPYTSEHITGRAWGRLERAIARADSALLRLRVPSPRPPEIARAVGTPQQDVLVSRLAAALRSRQPSLSVLLSDRGRGKSAAMGLALARPPAARPGRAQARACAERATETPRVAVTANAERAAHEVLRFAPPGTPFVPIERLLQPSEFGTIVVDEAAQLPVPTLQRMVSAHPRSRMVFATTVRGYEGTGRGFVLRFLRWLETEPRPVHRFELTDPIRWEAGDPLESFVFAALALDASPGDAAPAAETPAEIDRDELAHDALLRPLFGLLVHAHYRTTPADLHRALDAPNLRAHAIRGGTTGGGRPTVLAATLVALEGNLPRSRCEEMYRGASRVRGHALPDTLVSHSGRMEAGEMTMIRSVRIATHPERRREGLASALVQHIHRVYDNAAHGTDLFGTLFGATPDVIEFRRRLGYRLVRVGASRGARTGEPAAVMVRPVSPGARRMVSALRAALSRDLPRQLELMRADAPMDEALVEALVSRLPAPAAMTDAVCAEAVLSYAFGPRPFEAAALPIQRWIEQNASGMHTLDSVQRKLIGGRVFRGWSWREVTRDAGAPSVPAAMRLMRRAVRELVPKDRRPEAR